MKSGDPSRFRTIRAPDVWHWYAGHSVLVYTINPDNGKMDVVEMGMNSGIFVHAIEAGHYLGARMKIPREGKYALMGVTAMSGYTSDDIYVPTREELLNLFPQHEKVIKKLTVAN